MTNYFPVSADFCKEGLPGHQEAASRLNAPTDLKPRHTIPGRATVVNGSVTTVNAYRLNVVRSAVVHTHNNRCAGVSKRCCAVNTGCSPRCGPAAAEAAAGARLSHWPHSAALTHRRRRVSPIPAGLVTKGGH